MPLITLTIKPLFFSTTPSFFHFHPSFLFEIKPISYLTAFPFYLCRFVKIFPLDLFLKLSKVVLYSTFRTLLFEVYRHCYNEHLLSVAKRETEGLWHIYSIILGFFHRCESLTTFLEDEKYCLHFTNGETEH